MKTLRYIQMATLVATLGLASCTSDDAPVINDGELKIVATLGDIQTRVNSEGDGGKFLPNDVIYISNQYNMASVAFVTEQGTTGGKAEFKPNGEEKLVWSSSKEKFFASNYYGVRCDGIHDYMVNHPIQVDQSSVDSLRKADLIVAEPKELTFDATNGIVPMSFAHALSKVTVSVAAYNGFGNVNAKDMVIDNAVINSREFGYKVKGGGVIDDEGYTVFAFVNGELKVSEEVYWGNVQENSFSFKSISPLVNKDSSTGMYSFTAIIKPWTYSEEDVFMTFVIGGLEYKVLANADLCTEGFLQSGKHYHFDLTINKNASASFSKVSLLDWDEEEFAKEYYY